MSKTYFYDGAVVNAAFMNTIYYNSHVHDGSDADGHAQKVHILNDTTGWTDGTFVLHFSEHQFTPAQDRTCYYTKTPLNSAGGGPTAQVDIYLREWAAFGGTDQTSRLCDTTAGHIPAAICPTDYSNLGISIDGVWRYGLMVPFTAWDNAYPAAGMAFLTFDGRAYFGLVCNNSDGIRNGFNDAGWNGNGAKGWMTSKLSYQIY